MLFDILMENGNIFIQGGDFIKAKDNDLLRQNVIRRLTTPRGAIFFDKDFGSELYKWIKARDVSSKYIETHVKQILIECDEINPTTINIAVVRVGDGLYIKTSFQLWNLGLQEKLNIALKNNEIEAGFVGG